MSDEKFAVLMIIATLFIFYMSSKVPAGTGVDICTPESGGIMISWGDNSECETLSKEIKNNLGDSSNE